MHGHGGVRVGMGTHVFGFTAGENEKTKFKIYVHICIFSFLIRIQTCVGRQYLYLSLRL